MILTHRQLVAIVTFADGEDILLDPAFAGEDKGLVSINVGRESDESIIRLEPGGHAFVIQSGGRAHTQGSELPCWCGERHG